MIQDILNQFVELTSNFDKKSISPEKYKTVIKVMERDIPVDVPDESLEPQGCSTLKELLGRWNVVREKLQEFLEGINLDNKDELVYRHPFAGPLDIRQTLNFIDILVNNAVVFFASEQAGWITGQLLFVHGGHRMALGQ